MSPRSPRAGMTLIEVLMAISLLSVLSVSILLTLRVGLNALDKTNTMLIANRRAVSVERILTSQLAGLMPVVGLCPAGPDLPAARVSLFQGEPQSMRFVSSYSLAEAGRGLPRILEFQVIPGAEGQGVRLVVNERPYSGELSTSGLCLGMDVPFENGVRGPRFGPIEVGPQSFVLADKLAYCRFSYRQKLPPPVFAGWAPQWRFASWPTAVHVELAQLAPQAMRSPLVSVTAPVRVTRMPNVVYADR
jgi:prepilin-type N-terminal cleavage/methylation domain-containing protein